jgi:site-specific DNA-cytosine methylase
LQAASAVSSSGLSLRLPLSISNQRVFKGKYATGGDLRRREVPRFTQVANAVPPLLAELIGEILMALIWKQRTIPVSHRKAA